MGRKDQIIVGLDIGTTKTRAVVAELREDGGADVIGVGTSLSRGLRKGVVINIEDTVASVRKAVEEAVNFLVQEKGLTPDRAYSLASLAVDFHVAEAVDFTQVVAARIPKSLFR